MPGETQGQSHQISNITVSPMDAKLHVHMGDGFTASAAQNLDSYRGKILRMNLNGTAPSDNPFYNAGDGITARDFVYAYGVRNPFGGAWRGADGKLYEVENGPGIDRFCKVNAGQNFLWNGTDASMQNFAIYIWNPAHGPVNMAFIQTQTFGGSGFPAEKLGHMFVSESGTTWGTGFQANGKRIVEFVLDASGGLVSGPTKLIEYNGTGKASCVGLAAGADGLYFTDLYKDQDFASPIDTGASVLRVRFVGAADFTASVTSGPAPLAVQFTDASNVPAPTGWQWSFGDGGSSTSQNPSHTYTDEGIYHVRLTVTGESGLSVEQKNAFIRVGDIPRIAIIGGSMPPSTADAAVADHLRGRGFDVTSFDDEPANRPSAAQLGIDYDLVMVSSTISSGNVGGQFRTVEVPLLFWERALLQTDREAMTSNGVVVGNVTSINVLNSAHPIIQGLPAGDVTVYAANANMTVGSGTIAPAVSVLATRSGTANEYAVMAAEDGALLLGGYVAPARRVFVFLEDSSWLSATESTEKIMGQGACWALGAGAPTIAPPAGQAVYAGSSVTFTAPVTSAPPAALQWRRNGADLADSGRVSGSNTSLLTIDPVMWIDAGDYVLAAESSCGESVSAAATLTVRIRGDANCDDVLDDADVGPFVIALIDPDGYATAYPGCPIENSDGNSDGLVDGRDVAAFVDALQPS
jgi:PKD repeat protein